MKKYLRPSGWSIHALHHVHNGSVADKHYTKLESIVRKSGFAEVELTQLIASMDSDPETHYFLCYDEFPMRVCVSIQMVSRAVHLLT